MPDPMDLVTQRAQARVRSILADRYRLEALIGIGGTAAVYRARHRNGNRVAIKVLHLEYALDRDMRSRFLSEGYAANNIAHRCCVRVLDDATAPDGSPYLVMELLEGETLDQRLRSAGGRLPPAEVLAIFHQVLDVLAAAHAKGIVHRDVKPENLFLTVDGTVKILDFGIARLGDATVAHATVTGQVFGTPGFLPPEQALGEVSKIDHRTDLWAAGATMFTLLTGEYVYGETLPAKLIALAATTEPRPVSSVDSTLPQPIADIIDRALCWDRDQRWPSARAMQRAVEQANAIVYGVPLEAPRAAAVPAVPQEAPTRRRAPSRAVLIAIAGLVVVVAALSAIGAWVWWTLRAEPSREAVHDAHATASSDPPRTEEPERLDPEPIAPVAASALPSVTATTRRPPRPALPRSTGAFDYQ